MPGSRKKTKGGSPVQKELAGMAEPEIELEAQEARVPGNCRLPLEICQHIFKKLDCEEKITFSRTLIPWHELVTKERPMILCPKVAPILIEHLPRKALLQCRQLTRSWTQKQDQQYQVHPVHVRLPFEIASSKKKQIPKLINCFRSAQDIQNFLEDMREHVGNPFPGRNVKLDFSTMPETEFLINSLQLFKQLAKHIYYVEFIDIPIQLLRKFLLTLPMLKGLTMKETRGINYILIGTDLVLPRLGSLQNVEMQFKSKAVIDVVLDSCPIPQYMKRLSIDSSEVSRIPDVVYSFRNLEVLQTRLDIPDLQDFNDLRRIPPLRQADLNFNSPIKHPQLFRALEAFANTLIHLKAWPMLSCDHSTWINTDINLPNLKKLTLHGCTGSLDPFIKLTSLTDLTVECHDACINVEGNQVEFSEFGKPLKDSNIWKLIPSLKRLTVENIIYYRPLTLKQTRRSKRKCVINNAKRYV